MGQYLLQKAKIFFDRALTLASAKRHIQDKKVKVLFRVVDDRPFVVSFLNGRIEYMEGTDETANLIVESSRDTLANIFEGKISPAEAFHQRLILFEGIPYIGFPWLTRLMKIIQIGRD